MVALLLALTLGVVTPAFAVEVVVSGLSHDNQPMGGTVTIQRVDKVPPEVKTVETKPGGSKNTPRAVVDLEPGGTYVVIIKGVNPISNRQETGVIQITVDPGADPGGTHNVPMWAAEGKGNINQERRIAASSGTGTGSSTSSSGVTPNGTSANGRYTFYGRYGDRFNVGLKTQYVRENVDGLNLGVLPSGMDAINFDSDADGVQLGVGGRYITNNIPSILGAKRGYVGFEVSYLYAKATDNLGTVMFPAGTDLAYVNNTANVPITQLDRVSLKATVEEVRAELNAGVKLDMGPVGNMDQPNGDGRPSHGVSLVPSVFAFGGSWKHHQEVTFGLAGNDNAINSDLRTNFLGIGAGVTAGVPVGSMGKLKLSSRIDLTRFASSATWSQQNGNTLADANDTDTGFGRSLGFKAQLTVPIGKNWRLHTLAGWTRNWDAPDQRLSTSANEDSQITSGNRDRIFAGFVVTTSLDNFTESLVSDRRLKRDVHRVGTLPSGLPVYNYRYVWSPERHVGVMAQEARLLFPDAVIRMSNGYLAVDYSKIH